MSEQVTVYEINWITGIADPKLRIEKKTATRTERQVRVPTWGGRYEINDPGTCIYTLEEAFDRVQGMVDGRRREAERILAEAESLQQQLNQARDKAAIS